MNIIRKLTRSDAAWRSSVLAPPVSQPTVSRLNSTGMASVSGRACARVTGSLHNALRHWFSRLSCSALSRSFRVGSSSKLRTAGLGFVAATQAVDKGLTTDAVVGVQMELVIHNGVQPIQQDTESFEHAISPKGGGHHQR